MKFKIYIFLFYFISEYEGAESVCPAGLYSNAKCCATSMTFVFIFIVLNCNIAICYTIYSKKWLKLNQIPINEGRELMSRMLILIIILFSIDLCGKFAMKQLSLRINKRETLWMNQPKCIIEIVYPCKSASWIWFLHYKHKHSSAFTLIFPVAFRLIYSISHTFIHFYFFFSCESYQFVIGIH